MGQTIAICRYHAINRYIITKSKENMVNFGILDVQEGSIVRCITRLDETCKEIRNCARIIGDTSLYTKMEEASRRIKRDIVFASSLYII